MLSDLRTTSNASRNAFQGSRKRFGQVSAVQRFVQHLVQVDVGRTSRERRATESGHQDNRNVSATGSDCLCKLSANEIRHCLVGEYDIEPVRRGPKRLQRRAARVESNRLVA